MPSMTRAQGHANRAGNPSLCHPLMASTLHTLAMLVSIVARLFSSKPTTSTAACDGYPAQTSEANAVLDRLRETPPPPPPPTTTTITTAVAGIVRSGARGRTLEALMVNSTRSVRPSNHEGVLPAASHAKQQQQQYLLPRAGEAQRALSERRSGSGGGPPSPSRTASPPVPLRIAHVVASALLSLPRSGEEVRAS
jgi:hypothetical protein